MGPFSLLGEMRRTIAFQKISKQAQVWWLRHRRWTTKTPWRRDEELTAGLYPKRQAVILRVELREGIICRNTPFKVD
jgi:hypothetical protein